ncbi:MAG: Arm DNA-binding domain-containing protein, partial [Methylocystis sp.]
MKSKGKHPHNALTSVKVRQSPDQGRYADGNGLYLVVDPSGAKRWLLRTIIHGRRGDMGLGGVQLVPLAEAREKAQHYRKIAREGGTPLWKSGRVGWSCRPSPKRYKPFMPNIFRHGRTRNTVPSGLI